MNELVVCQNLSELVLRGSDRRPQKGPWCSSPGTCHNLPPLKGRGGVRGYDRLQ